MTPHMPVSEEIEWCEHCGPTDDEGYCACGCSAFGDYCGCTPQCRLNHWGQRMPEAKDVEEG